MYHFHRKHYKWLRHIPRKKHLAGGRLHRLLGEEFFAADLWKPTRRGIAGGLALGLLVGLTPTMGVQLFIAGICAYALKVNIPVALASTFITNPLTAAFIYPLEYELGLRLAGAPELSELAGYSGMLRNFVRHAKPLWVGSLVAGSVLAATAYGLVSLLWIEARHLHDAMQKTAPHSDQPDGNDNRAKSAKSSEQE
jgi:uncharacterized protein (DUF2062 family)